MDRIRVVFDLAFGLYVDQLTAVMLVMVTFVSSLVHIYAAGYMKGDQSFYRFFSWLPLFVFSMLMLSWPTTTCSSSLDGEAVGLCLPADFYHWRRSAGNAAKGVHRQPGWRCRFWSGIMLIFTTFGTLSFAGEDGVFARISEAEFRNER
ncbi:MAG: hypothetical protein R2839_00395 [Thermomicrobiales bacterium]